MVARPRRLGWWMVGASVVLFAVGGGCFAYVSWSSPPTSTCTPVYPSSSCSSPVDPTLAVCILGGWIALLLAVGLLAAGTVIVLKRSTGPSPDRSH